jgi:hypothetical protein
MSKAFSNKIMGYGKKTVKEEFFLAMAPIIKKTILKQWMKKYR